MIHNNYSLLHITHYNHYTLYQANGSLISFTLSLQCAFINIHTQGKHFQLDLFMSSINLFTYYCGRCWEILHKKGNLIIYIYIYIYIYSVVSALEVIRCNLCLVYNE